MENKNNLTVPVAIVVAGALIAGGIFFSNKSSEITLDQTKEEKVRKEIVINPVTNKDHVRGNPNADIVLVEFSDTECPFCKRFHETMNQIMDKYGKDGKVAWVYRHFPLDQIHEKARKEAEATECATEIGGNNGFWDFINTLFEKKAPSNNGFTVNELQDLANEIGLDEVLFENCLSSGKHAKTVEAQYQDGIKAGAQGTPYNVLILNKKDKIAVNGAMPFDIMDIIIGMAVNGKKADTIQEFMDLVNSRASESAMQEFLQKNYPVKITE